MSQVGYINFLGLGMFGIAQLSNFCPAAIRQIPLTTKKRAKSELCLQNFGERSYPFSHG
jgi:hypothetical protein